MQRDGSINLNKYQIRAIEELGLTLDQLEGHNWEGSNGYSTIEYLKKQKKNGIDVAQAMDYIRGVDGEFKIDAITLGLTKDQLEGHNWEGNNGYSTIEYLKKQKKNGIDVAQAMENIRGVDGECKIKAIVELGLTKDQIQDHNWEGSNGYSTIRYLKKQKNNGIDVAQAMDYIRGVDGEFKIDAITLGLTKDQLEGHNWEGDNGYSTIEYLEKQKNNGIDVAQAMDYIRGVDGEFKIDAITLGLTKDQLEGHNWEGSNGFTTIRYLKKQKNNGIDVAQAMENIRGVNGKYKIEAIEFVGLTKDQLEGHNWEGYNGYSTIEYLEKQKNNGIDVAQAMENIRGVDGRHKIEAIELGLTKDQLEGHNWEGDNGYYTIEYLEKQKNNGIDVAQAMDYIRGVDVKYKIEAIRLGFNKEQFNNLDIREAEFKILQEVVNQESLVAKLNIVNSFLNSAINQFEKSKDLKIDAPDALINNLNIKDCINLSQINKENTKWSADLKATNNAIKATDVKQLFAEKQQEHHR